jgi:CHAD domain-containing protein
MLTTLAWIEAGEWSVDARPASAELRRRPIKALAAEQFESRWRKVVKKGRDLAALTPAEQHRLRIKVKQLRYACGFFGGLYAGEARKAHKAFSAAARDLQDRLGALNDVAFSRDLIARVAGLDDEPKAAAEVIDPNQAFAAGALIGQAAASGARRLKAAAKAHRALRKAEAFW